MPYTDQVKPLTQICYENINLINHTHKKVKCSPACCQQSISLLLVEKKLNALGMTMIVNFATIGCRRQVLGYGFDIRLLTNLPNIMHHTS